METLNISGHNNQKPYLSSLAAKQPIAIDKSRSMPYFSPAFFPIEEASRILIYERRKGCFSCFILVLRGTGNKNDMTKRLTQERRP